jgi:DNA polymerase-3 subunit alpha/error-prone DNA polymerase
MYINCHSYHSLRYGTIPLNELVQQAACGVETMALTDINTVTGIYDFIKECKAVAIKPLVGIEFRYNNKLLYIGLAKTQQALRK